MSQSEAILEQLEAQHSGSHEQQAEEAEQSWGEILCPSVASPSLPSRREMAASRSRSNSPRSGRSGARPASAPDHALRPMSPRSGAAGTYSADGMPRYPASAAAALASKAAAGSEASLTAVDRNLHSLMHEQASFEVLDRNQDGVISRQEWQQAKAAQAREAKRATIQEGAAYAPQVDRHDPDILYI